MILSTELQGHCRNSFIYFLNNKIIIASKHLTKDSWLRTFFLVIITFGFYIFYWYGRLDKDARHNKKNGFMFLIIGNAALYIVSLVLSSAAGFLVRVPEATGLIQFLLKWVPFVNFFIIQYLNFRIRSYLMKQYKIEINPVATFMFGPLHLQHSISRNYHKISPPVIKKKPVTSNEQMARDYIKKYKDKYPMESIIIGLKEMKLSDLEMQQYMEKYYHQES